MLKRARVVKLVMLLMLFNLLTSSFAYAVNEEVDGNVKTEEKSEFGLTSDEVTKLKSELAKSNNLENPQFFIKEGVNEIKDGEEKSSTFVTPKLKYASAKSGTDSSFYTKEQTKFMLQPTASAKLEEMAKKFNTDRGLEMQLVSGWRPWALQNNNYDGGTWVAKAGASEHQTGWGIDLDTSEKAKTVDRDGDGIKETAGDLDIAGTKMYEWLKKNAHTYGFIERYPPNSKEKTGINPETWHWRYVGVDLATLIKKTGVTFEEVYTKYGSSGGASNVIEETDEINELNKDTSNLTTDTSATGNIFEYDKTYSFDKVGVLKDNTTKQEHKKLWLTILDGKTADLKKTIEGQGEEKYKSSAIEIDLDTEDGKSYWGTDPNELLKATTNTIFRVKGGDTDYYIEVPKAEYDDKGNLLNGDIIKLAINSIVEYKKVVKQGIMVGTITHSYNVFRMSPENAVSLIDLLEKNDKMKEDGNMWNIRGDIGKMKYNLVYYFHPIFGKIPAEDLKGNESDKGIKNEHLNNLADGIEVKTGNKDMGSYTVDSTYLSYVRKQGIEHTILSNLKSGTVKKLKLRVNEYKTDVGFNKTIASDLIESVFPVLIPIKYKESGANPKHFELKANSFTQVEGFYVSVRNNYVMTNDGDTYKITGGYETYGMDLNALVLMAYTKVGGEESTEETEKETMGGVTSLWYKEAMYDFAGVLGDPIGYITGRELRFNNDYGKKMKLDSTNVDLFGVMSKRGGLVGLPMRYYAFGSETGTETTKEGNIGVGKTPTSFMMMTKFENGKDNANMVGFVIYRNYNYWNEEGLIKHLEAQKTETKSTIDSVSLLKLIKGSFSVETMPLTFEEWLRVQEIKKELDKTLSDYLVSAVNIICLVFGVLLFFYSLISIVAYLVDCVGIFETSVLGVITWGKLRSIPFSLTKEELGTFRAFQDSKVKYITWKGMIIYFVAIGVIAMLFLQVEPILQFIIYIFFRLNTLLNGLF